MSPDPSELLEAQVEPTVRAVLEFERSAAAKKDYQCYTIEEALAD